MTKKITAEYVQGVVAEGYPEVGDFKERKDLQKFYKHLSVEQLEDWVEVEGLEITPTDSEPIYRMRLAMAILYLHFPKAPAKTKKKSKYADYSTEDLVQMAIDKEVAFEVCEDQRILRMRAIMALRAAGHIE